MAPILITSLVSLQGTVFFLIGCHP